MTLTTLYTLYAILAAGAGALFLCMPSTRPILQRLRWTGVVMGIAALAAVAVYCTRWIGPDLEGRAFFVIFAIIAIISAVRVVTHPRPIYSALYFVLVILAVTGLCVLAAAEFLAAALVIIYGGAILITYLFVIMLAQTNNVSAYDKRAREPFAAVTMGFILAASATLAMATSSPIRLNASPAVDAAAIDAAAGNVRALGTTLLTRYVMAVEIAGVLLLVAIVGAIAIAKKRIDPEALTPAERVKPTEDVRQAGREAPPF